MTNNPAVEAHPLMVRRYFSAQNEDFAFEGPFESEEEACRHWPPNETKYARIISTKSPQAIRMLKFAFNAADDGLAGLQVFAGEATRLAYTTDEAVEGRDAFLEKRDPDWSRFPRYF